MPGAFGGGQLVGDRGQVLCEIIVKLSGETGAFGDLRLEANPVDGKDDEERDEKGYKGYCRSERSPPRRARDHPELFWCAGSDGDSDETGEHLEVRGSGDFVEAVAGDLNQTVDFGKLGQGVANRRKIDGDRTPAFGDKQPVVGDRTPDYTGIEFGDSGDGRGGVSGFSGCGTERR